MTTAGCDFFPIRTFGGTTEDAAVRAKTTHERVEAMDKKCELNPGAGECGIYCLARGLGIDSSTIRASVVETIEKSPLYKTLSGLSDEEFKGYCTKMRKRGEFVDALFLLAAADLYDACIIIIGQSRELDECFNRLGRELLPIALSTDEGKAPHLERIVPKVNDTWIQRGKGRLRAEQEEKGSKNSSFEETVFALKSRSPYEDRVRSTHEIDVVTLAEEVELSIALAASFEQEETAERKAREEATRRVEGLENVEAHFRSAGGVPANTGVGSLVVKLEGSKWKCSSCFVRNIAAWDTCEACGKASRARSEVETRASTPRRGLDGKTGAAGCFSGRGSVTIPKVANAEPTGALTSSSIVTRGFSDPDTETFGGQCVEGMKDSTIYLSPPAKRQTQLCLSEGTLETIGEDNALDKFEEGGGKISSFIVRNAEVWSICEAGGTSGPEIEFRVNDTSHYGEADTVVEGIVCDASRSSQVFAMAAKGGYIAQQHGKAKIETETLEQWRLRIFQKKYNEDIWIKAVYQTTPRKAEKVFRPTKQEPHSISKEKDHLIQSDLAIAKPMSWTNRLQLEPNEPMELTSRNKGEARCIDKKKKADNTFMLEIRNAALTMAREKFRISLKKAEDQVRQKENGPRGKFPRQLRTPPTPNFSSSDSRQRDGESLKEETESPIMPKETEEQREAREKYYSALWKARLNRTQKRNWKLFSRGYGGKDEAQKTPKRAYGKRPQKPAKKKWTKSQMSRLGKGQRDSTGPREVYEFSCVAGALALYKSVDLSWLAQRLADSKCKELNLVAEPETLNLASDIQTKSGKKSKMTLKEGLDVAGIERMWEHANIVCSRAFHGGNEQGHAHVTVEDNKGRIWICELSYLGIIASRVASTADLDRFIVVVTSRGIFGKGVDSVLCLGLSSDEEGDEGIEETESESEAESKDLEANGMKLGDLGGGQVNPEKDGMIRDDFEDFSDSELDDEEDEEERETSDPVDAQKSTDQYQEGKFFETFPVAAGALKRNGADVLGPTIGSTHPLTGNFRCAMRNVNGRVVPNDPDTGRLVGGNRLKDMCALVADNVVDICIGVEAHMDENGAQSVRKYVHKEWEDLKAECAPNTEIRN